MITKSFNLNLDSGGVQDLDFDEKNKNVWICEKNGFLSIFDLEQKKIISRK